LSRASNKIPLIRSDSNKKRPGTCTVKEVQVYDIVRFQVKTWELGRNVLTMVIGIVNDILSKPLSELQVMYSNCLDKVGSLFTTGTHAFCSIYALSGKGIAAKVRRELDTT